MPVNHFRFPFALGQRVKSYPSGLSLHPSIGMFLASILALWLLTAPRIALASSSVGDLGLGNFAFLSARDSSPSQQQSESTQGSAGQASSSSQTSSTAPTVSNPQPKHKHKKKPSPTPTDSNTPPKKVVTHGSTQDPPTHLAPSMSDEQTAKTKAANAELVSAAQSNLQKVNGRTLTVEQQETVDQVRKFIEQSRTADQEGDLQRAATLANKAKLLSDSLEETTHTK